MKKKHSTLLLPQNRFEPAPLQRFEPSPAKPFWRWGDDNLLPEMLARMARSATIHRRIINDKADYITGKGFTCEASNKKLEGFISEANGQKEPLRAIFTRLAFDKILFGNAFLEVVTDAQSSFLSIYHQDASRCRVAQDDRHILLHHDWRHFKSEEAITLPLYPHFEEQADGTRRSIVHYKEYEPAYTHYGVPAYIAGMQVSEIASKTDQWNIARLENSFQLSGVMILDGEVENEHEAHRLIKQAERRFAGEPGQVLFMIKNGDEADNSKFVPIASQSEGDWQGLHEQASSDIVVAHSWFRSLSGLDYSGGFDAERILHEYEIALNTLILGEQEELLQPICRIIEQHLGCETASLQVVNRPPTRSKPLYMKVWEARKYDGLDYDPTDPHQNLFVAQITKYGLTNID